VAIVDSIRWFKETFGSQIQAAVDPTPFGVDLLVAIATQETGGIWGPNRNKLPLDQLLEICVGDTLDENAGRKAFPKTAAHLLEKPRGDEMLTIGHAALVAMSQHVNGFTAAAGNPRKFCHGYGIFQYDIQFFLEDPDYFLQRRWRTFSASLGKCLEELGAAAARLKLADGHKLNDSESVAVAIAYNTGRFIPSKGLQQGFKPKDGPFYGEAINDFLRLSKTIATPQLAAPIAAAVPGAAAIPPPTPVVTTGDIFAVDITNFPLRVREQPTIDKNDPEANVKWKLPDGHLVRRISGSMNDRFLEIETSLNGALIHGFASTKFLVPAAGVIDIPEPTPATTAPTTGVIEVFAPNRTGIPVRRTMTPGALSLNEKNMPGRAGTTPEELRQELWDIIDYLDVEKPAHLRYQRTPKSTFCNIYAHDFCTLARAYLPRVWWTPAAIEKLTRGEAVVPKLEATIEEQRANNLFDWLRDFGLRFGWRQTSTLTKLQNEANLGAVGLVIGKNRSNGAPGHVAMVVPEGQGMKARRDGLEVVVPLTSQAGATNFRVGTGPAWWLSDKFSDRAFWIHP